MNEWLDVLDREYLADYIAAGGGCVKFGVGDPHTTHRAFGQLQTLAVRRGFLLIELKAAQTRLNRSDELFFEIARNVDWDRLARVWVETALTRQGLKVDSAPADLSSVAASAGVEESEARGILRDALLSLYRDYAMCQEFRLAMVQLCKAQVEGLENCAWAVKNWLRGELRRVSEVRDAKLFQKIGRHNARLMLQSLAYWLRRNGESGMVLTVDIARCVETAKRFDRLPGFYYSSGALNEAYEVLRQLIDSSSSLPGVLIAVSAPPAFLSDEKRGVDRYQALRMRIFDDVRSRGRQNVLAPLVRLESQTQAPEDGMKGAE
jgi:hypothetical protein